MKSRTRVLIILCLLCVVHASRVLSKGITEFGEKISVQDQDLLRNLRRENDRTDKPNTVMFRDKRALGLLLSGLAQIFGYTVTPVQLASLSNPNMTTAAAMSNSTAMGNATMRQLTASSRPISTNTTATTTPRQQETIRFTGVVNFGNNSDIIGHLQRYEQMFHGSRNNTRPMMTTTSRPATSMPKSAENLSLDLRTNSPTKPPLLTPFFVKIPLPIAPNLLPITTPIEDVNISYPVPLPIAPNLLPTTTPIEDVNLSYPLPLITIASEFSEDELPETPVRTEQEMVYRSNEDTERYTVEDKEIYDEKDVMKPVSKYTHKLYVDEPSLSKQQDERYNEVQRKQEEYVARMKEQQAQRDRDQEDEEREDEINEMHRNREEEIVNRNRDRTSKYSSSEERRPAYENEEDEESVERYEERMDQANRSDESSERPAEKDEREKTERYPDYDDNDDPGKQSGEYKQDDDQPLPIDFEKYIEVAYNQQLPIGDYFHESNPEEIRDSYGEVLNNKKLEDDRLSSYFSMFKNPYVDGLDYQRAQDPKDASQENKRKETSAANGYDEHLKRIEKLREEYALPAPESKYEEYDISDEDEANRNGKQNEKDQNHDAAKSKKSKTEHGKENVRAKTTSESSKNQLQRESEEAKSQEELDLVKYTPLIVPIRYIDASDRVEQASTRQLKYKKSEEKPEKKSEKKSDNSQVPTTIDNVDLPIKEKPTPQIASLPERPRQLHEGEEHKEFQLWPPPFDYAFDNTERTNTIVPANPSNLNYYQNIVTNIADNDANNDSSSDQPTGYLVVVGNPVHPYQYPTNIYYFPKGALNPQDQEPHLNAASTHPQRQLYISQQNVNQQPVQGLNPNPTQYNYNETTKNPHNYYYQSQEAPTDAFNHYRYAFGEYASESSELPNIDTGNQIFNMENWSNRIYPSQPRGVGVVQSPPTPAQLQNVASSNQNVQMPSKRQRYPQPPRRQKSSRTRDQRQDNRKAKVLSRHSVPRRKPFHDPQSAHNFFGFSKNDYSFDGESGNASKVAKENGKNTKKSHVFVAPEPAAYHHDESTTKHTDELENDTEKAVVKEYRNRVAILKVSEQRQSRPNGPIHYVDFTRNI